MRDLKARLGEAALLVAGDVMLDRYWFGDVDRIGVTLRTHDREADVRIVWEGGAGTELVMALNKTDPMPG